MPAHPWRRPVRIALVGALCALIVGAGGWMLRRTVLGRDDAEAHARVQAEVRETFDAMARQLRDLAMALEDPAAVRSAADADTVAARRLFADAEDLAAGTARVDAAVTVYDAEGIPLAWAGRPSEIGG